MPTDDTAVQHRSGVVHAVGTKQSDVSTAGMMNVDMASQQHITQEITQPNDTMVGQLNIRQRTSGISKEVSRLMQMPDLELRPENTFDQHDSEVVKKFVDDFLSGDGNVTMTEDLPEFDAEDVDTVLNSLETNEGESVFGSEEQKPMVEDPVVSSVVPSKPAPSYVTSVDGTDTECLYSPSPHFTSMQSSAAVQSPLSPTGVTGAWLQQLSIDNGSHVEMAIGGSGAPSLQRICYVPTQVCQFLNDIVVCRISIDSINRTVYSTRSSCK